MRGKEKKTLEKTDTKISKSRKQEEVKMGQEMLKWSISLEPWAKAFGISSHLIRFHQITQSTILTEHAPERATPALCFRQQRSVSCSFIL